MDDASVSNEKEASVKKPSPTFKRLATRKGALPNRYLRVRLIFHDREGLDYVEARFIKAQLEVTMRSFFGIMGGTCPFSILKFDKTKSEMIFQVPAAFYVKLRAAMFITHHMYDRCVTLRTLQSSAHLACLSAYSRQYTPKV